MIRKKKTFFIPTISNTKNSFSNCLSSDKVKASTDRAIQFRRWATNVLKRIFKKGYIL